MLKPALFAFLDDRLPETARPRYESVAPAPVVLYAQGRPSLVYFEKLVEAPLEPVGDLEGAAWETLLFAATLRERGVAWPKNPFVDTPTDKAFYCERDNVRIYFNEPEYVARLPHREGLYGLVVYNPDALKIVRQN